MKTDGYISLLNGLPLQPRSIELYIKTTLRILQLFPPSHEGEGDLPSTDT